MRNSFRYTVCLALALFMVAFHSAEAMAQQKIAVVNYQRVIAESKAAESVQKQLEKKRKEYQDEFAKMERKLVDDEKALVEMRAAQNGDDFADKKKEFEESVAETRKLVQQRQRGLEEAAAKAMSDLREQVTKIVAEIADASGYDMVLTRQNVILVKPEQDITEEVLKSLNKEVKDIKLNVN